MSMETQQATSTPIRRVEDFFDNEYRDYAVYTISNRAIPSVIDGFKPSQRKIAYAANRLWKTGNEKPMKVFQLGGQAAAISFFHHGSLDGTIIGMTQDFKNSMPIFQGIGQFGSLRSPEAGAPRYVGVKFNENFKLLYKDFELTTAKYEEGEEIEPQFFLPIIPTVLLNGGSGIAVGFATNILNRHPLDLIDACGDALDGKPVRDLRPWIRGFHGTFERSPDSPRSWSIRGIHIVKNTSTVEVTEIPPSFTYEKYENYLDSLVEKGILSSYDDHSSERVNYVLKFPRTTLAEYLKKDKLGELLKMREGEGENLTTLDEHGKLKVFERAEEIVQYFVEFRLGYYGRRKNHLLASLDHDLLTLNSRALFVKAIIDGSLSVANVKKADLLKAIEALGIQKQDGGYEFLLSMQIHTLTAEKYAELLKKLDEITKERARVEKTSPEDFYRHDLKELKKQVQKSYGA
jgi:DNA topoisomerase-2